MRGLDDRYKPDGARPDLKWAQSYDLTSALYQLPRESGWESSEGRVLKRTKNPAWTRWYEERYANPDSPITPPPDPPYFFAWVDVDAYWIRLELQERRDLDHAKCMARMKGCSTRYLLTEWLRIARITGWYSPCYDSNTSYGVSLEDIKAELATREHVPGRIEAKANRRTAALMHRKNKLRHA